MFMRKFALNKIFSQNLKFSLSSLMKFSSSHGHGHSEDEPQPSQKPFYDRVSYNKKLKKGEREP
jgi:hypothetical protein